MDYSIHKIKFNKSVKQKEQKKIIKLLLNKKVFEIKKLKKSNDVEHLKRAYFISKSFKNEAYPNFVIIVGRLKPSHVKLHGAGLSDIFNKIKSTVSNVVSNIFSLRDSFNNTAQSMLKIHGDKIINSISVFRAPLKQSSLLVKVLNGFSSENIPYEKLFHLGFIISVGETKLRVEKNQVISIDEVYTLKPETEIIEVPLNSKQITFNDFLNNAVNKFGKDRIFKYSAFNFNCQCYVRDTLEANGLYNTVINDFVYQPMENVIKNLNGSVPKTINAITNTAAYINKLIGGGSKNNLSKEELKILMKVLKILEQ